MVHNGYNPSKRNELPTMMNIFHTHDDRLLYVISPLNDEKTVFRPRHERRSQRFFQGVGFAVGRKVDKGSQRGNQLLLPTKMAFMAPFGFKSIGSAGEEESALVKRLI